VITSDDGRPLYKFPVDGYYVVPGDIHFPIHNPTLVNRYTLENIPKGATLFLQGDTGDQEAFSRFPKDPEKIAKSHSIKKEREHWTRYLDRWLEVYDKIIIGPGNHEYRCQKLVYGNPGFIGMGWWWPYQGLFADSRITLLDYGFRACIGKVVIEHGDKLKGASAKFPAYGVAEAARDGMVHVFGHTHKFGYAEYTSYVQGKARTTVGINVGTLVDTRKQDYANEPNWQPGAVHINNGIAYTYSEARR